MEEVFMKGGMITMDEELKELPQIDIVIFEESDVIRTSGKDEWDGEEDPFFV